MANLRPIGMDGLSRAMASATSLRLWAAAVPFLKLALATLFPAAVEFVVDDRAGDEAGEEADDSENQVGHLALFILAIMAFLAGILIPARSASAAFFPALEYGKLFFPTFGIGRPPPETLTPVDGRVKGG